jgi:hypothetical protein
VEHVLPQPTVHEDSIGMAAELVLQPLMAHGGHESIGPPIEASAD